MDDLPRDQNCLQAYGALNDEVDRLLDNVKNGQLDPQMVVDDIIKLIETPLGQRPFRTIPGPDFGLASVNPLKDRSQQGLLAALSLEQLDLASPNRRI